MRLPSAILLALLLAAGWRAAAQPPDFAHAGLWSFNAQCPQIASGNFALISGRDLPITGREVSWKGSAGTGTVLALAGRIDDGQLNLRGDITSPRGFLYKIDFSGPIGEGRFQISGAALSDRSGQQAHCELSGWRTGR